MDSAGAEGGGVDSKEVPEGEVHVRRALRRGADVEPDDELAMVHAQAAADSVVEPEERAIVALPLPDAAGIVEPDHAEGDAAIEHLRVRDPDARLGRGDRLRPTDEARLRKAAHGPLAADALDRVDSAESGQLEERSS